MAQLDIPTFSLPPTPRDSEAAHALLVDDEPELLRALARSFVSRGYKVSTATCGEEALEIVGAQHVDLVITDLTMPGMDGLELTSQIHAKNEDLPIVLTTALASVDTAIRAMELGARRYVRKPIDLGELHGLATQLTSEFRLARAKRTALGLVDVDIDVLSNRRGPNDAFSLALHKCFMAYQPIVDFRERSIFGHEALIRCKDPAFPHPGALLAVGEALGRINDIGRTVRELVASVASDTSSTFFVNLHAMDLVDEELFGVASPLHAIAKRVVLEITERASVHEIVDVKARIARLKALGYRIAIDDLGAGYSGLTSFALIAPHVVKLDMSLVRGVDSDSLKQTMVRQMLSMCTDLGASVVAEGVETAAERDYLDSVGCSLMQGYLFAKPAYPFPDVRWA
ncbi:MAG: EAL domain-containing protein [Polyangiaceae bacterium]